jgi:hypothetical protein
MAPNFLVSIAINRYYANRMGKFERRQQVRASRLVCLVGLENSSRQDV